MIENFYRAIDQKQLQDLLRIPFYLIYLVNLYKESGKLPRSKSEVFEQLLESRIQLDIEHFRTTIDLESKRKTIMETLERIALAMETLGRNHIDNNEFQMLLPEESLRTLIKHCTVWKTGDEDESIWQFEHQNFQEYLAARVLSRQSIEVIKDFIAFKPDHRKVIPSWVNTLSFLVNIFEQNNPLFRDLLDWMLNVEPELVIKFEPDKVEIDTRIHIFKEIFNYYKKKQIWIDHDKFHYNELAYFGQSDETIDFLLKELENPAHYTTITNAIDLLNNLEIPDNQKKRTSHLLAKFALDGDENEQVQTAALMALAELKLNSREVIDQVLPILKSSENDLVRYGLYYFLHTSSYLEENIGIFLDGIERIRFDPTGRHERSRLLQEQMNLEIGLQKAKTPDSIKKILAYFKENPRDLHGATFEKTIPIIADNGANAYKQDSSLFKLVAELFATLVNKHLEKEAKQFINFFDKTDTRYKAFTEFFDQKSSNDDYLLILATLANEKCLGFIIEQFEKKNINDDDIRAFQNILVWKNNDLFLPFNKLINEKSGNKFPILERKDFGKERAKRKQYDIDLLFDKQGFIHSMEVIFTTEKKEHFTTSELFDLETKHWENPYFSDLAIHTLREIANDKTVSFKDATEAVNKNWDWFRIANLYEYLKGDNELALSEKQQDWIARWCTSNLDKIDFKTALVKKTNRTTSTSWLAIYLWFFLRKLDLKYPKEVLLDMLLFDWAEYHEMVGIGYLEERLDKADMTERILKNLHQGIENDDVLKNHIGYCLKHEIKDVSSFALHEIVNADRNYEVREVALEAFCKLSDKPSELQTILPKIEDDFKWNVVDQLLKQNSKYVYDFLRQILANGEEQDQFKAAEYLIKLQDLEGLNYYVEWMKKYKKFPRSFSGKSCLQSLRNLEAIPFLIELLKINYEDDFVQNEFERLDQAVLDALTAIALQSDQNYREIKETVEGFVGDYSSRLRNINFLYSFLEKLEQKYYVNKSEKLDVSDVIKKLEKIR